MNQNARTGRQINSRNATQPIAVSSWLRRNHTLHFCVVHPSSSSSPSCPGSRGSSSLSLASAWNKIIVANLYVRRRAVNHLIEFCFRKKKLDAMSMEISHDAPRNSESKSNLQKYSIVCRYCLLFYLICFEATYSVKFVNQQP